uniref:Alpha-gurjunene synthase n=1 Tax=Marchantia polymorpha TaxID=3197 RepID=MTSL4_MARPO|nr:RecName: Full=Alpha-gurjunene synthase; AltName: Full=5-hydroxy-alpha-gurjunene synthase; AltName: Full=Microbial terpene synthase-like 4; Short=MpMTPSL4; AltName: Full=Sesquiterpene synthase [Marchantia polymorpha]APP91789.1 terpene synthase-like protein [Marchantia polymorpha]
MAPTLDSDSTVLSIRSDFRQGRVQRQLKSELYRNDNRMSVENDFRAPYIQLPYPQARLNPKTTECMNITFDWLSSMGIDKQVDPSVWQAFVASRLSDIVGYSCNEDIEPEDFLWLCKFTTWLFIFDSMMDDGHWAENICMSSHAILEMNLILMWNDPENERLLECSKSILDLVMAIDASGSRLQLDKFHADMVDARKKSKSLLDVKMGVFTSAFRDCWMEYVEDVPAEYTTRIAQTFQRYISSCLWEEKNRKEQAECMNVADYVTLRRFSGCVEPYFVYVDRIIEHKRRKSPISHIPNTLFYGEHMQNMLAAATDVICWHNDIFSFPKETIREGDKHNLVYTVFQQYNCHSCTQAGELIVELLHDRIAEMEFAYEKLRSAAAPEFHPAIDVYIKNCRDWISGSHEFHMNSSRYNVRSFSGPPENVKHINSV